MPRRYYRRRTVVVRPKKKWGSNITNFNLTTTGDTTAQVATTVLVQNAASSSNPTPVILKCGNFKLQGDAYYQSGNSTSLIQLMLYVFYLPEGATPETPAQYQALLTAHPEWILAWKYVEGISPTSAKTENLNTYSFSSRLKRNLNSGDRVVLVGMATASSALTAAKFSGMCQFWTCAN